MDWGIFPCAKAESRNGLDESPTNRGISADEAELPDKGFSENERWWQPTDTRQEWGLPPKNEDRCGNVSMTPKNRRKTEYHTPQVEETQETRKSEENCEIVVTSTKRYHSGDTKMKTGTGKIQNRYFVPTGGVPMRMYVNCSPDRFATLEKYCKDALMNETDIENHHEYENGILVKTVTKTVERTHDGQYEERTEQRYTFPKTARVTFHVAMHSESIH